MLGFIKNIAKLINGEELTSNPIQRGMKMGEGFVPKQVFLRYNSLLFYSCNCSCHDASTKKRIDYSKIGKPCAKQNGGEK